MMIFENPGPAGEFNLDEETKAFESWRDTGNSENFIKYRFNLIPFYNFLFFQFLSFVYLFLLFVY
ncbi:hypothetical protein ES708_34924 [subsurface metagenome]